MRHQKLTELESLVKAFLVSMINQAYARGMKYSYRVSWTKGDKEIEADGHKTRHYYIFRFYILDKTLSLAGKEITLYANFYPVRALQTAEKLEELAYNEFLLNGVQSLANATFAALQERLAREFVQPTDVEINQVVEDIKEQAKTPKIII